MAGEFGQLNGVGGVVGARARDHRNAAVGALHAEAHNLLVLRVAQGGALAGGAAGNQRIDAGFNLPVDQAAVGFVIHFAACGEGGDQCGGDAFEDGVAHGFVPPVSIDALAVVQREFFK